METMAGTAWKITLEKKKWLRQIYKGKKKKKPTNTPKPQAGEYKWKLKRNCLLTSNFSLFWQIPGFRVELHPVCKL